MNRFARPLAAAFAGLAGLAAAPAQAGDWGGIFSAVTYVSDYRYQGVSSTDLRPALQGYVHWQRADGMFAGVFTSQVHYYDGGPKLEVDAYAGKHFELDGGRTEITPETLYSTFPDNHTPGPTFDFLELKLEARRRQGPLTLLGTTAFTPQASYGGGETWLAEGEADFALSPRLTLKAMAGRRWGHRGVDRTYWSVGAALGFGKTLAGPRYLVEVKYQGTDLDRIQCGFNPRICSPALVGSLTMALPPIL
ncbi:TorF family putative porin [Phenylobacterium sp.]|uniref:TorF family putative porin n=1 Tax=Phenylobacterium sp. TaxID=1871053 RepID=UPI002DF05534|nr:TorF family putative porin [Phenylobacterium sp.]